MSVISQEVWDKVVKDSPYVHITHRIYALEDVGRTIEDMDHLIDFLNTHIPEKVLIRNKIKLVDGVVE